MNLYKQIIMTGIICTALSEYTHADYDAVKEMQRLREWSQQQVATMQENIQRILSETDEGDFSYTSTDSKTTKFDHEITWRQKKIDSIPTKIAALEAEKQKLLGEIKDLQKQKQDADHERLRNDEVGKYAISKDTSDDDKQLTITITHQHLDAKNIEVKREESSDGHKELRVIVKQKQKIDPQKGSSYQVAERHISQQVMQQNGKIEKSYSGYRIMQRNDTVEITIALPGHVGELERKNIKHKGDTLTITLPLQEKKSTSFNLAHNNKQDAHDAFSDAPTPMSQYSARKKQRADKKALFAALIK